MKTKKLHLILSLLSVSLGCLLWTTVATAQDYPKSPVQIVIPFGPGGLTDLFWRGTTDILGSHLKGTVVCVNKPGGGGVVGTSFVANSKPDGYTVVSANSDPLTISPVFTASVPYNPEKDFTYLAKLASFAFTIDVLADSPFKTIEDVVDFARKNPRKLKCSVMGIGSTPHTILGVFNRDANVDIVPVPFDSGGESVTNLLGGHTDLLVVSLPAVRPHVLSGKVRVLAVCSPKRLKELPDVPTMAERGFKKSSIATGVGLAGPKGLPSAIVSKWEEVTSSAVKDPKFIELVDKLGGVVVDYKNGEAYKAELMSDLTLYKEVLPSIPGK